MPRAFAVARQHHDKGNEWFAPMLDSCRVYSCAGRAGVRDERRGEAFHRMGTFYLLSSAGFFRSLR